MGLTLQYLTEDGNDLNERLKEEEALAKDMLDAKITAQNDHDVLTQDCKVLADQRTANREETIRLQIKLSNLKSANQRTGAELKNLSLSNDVTLKSNADLSAQNAALSDEIHNLVNRVALNDLLKEVQLDELALLAESNQSMTTTFKEVMQRWSHINRD